VPIKLLPCSHCGTARTRTGSPYWLGRWPSKVIGRFTYRCSCGRSFTLRPQEFGKLAPARREDLEACGTYARSVRDVGEERTARAFRAIDKGDRGR
jgi:hypothetical protein